ncbi:peptidoglycan DD-metalloendopeptidase family protein, partial [Treponema porcinum]
VMYTGVYRGFGEVVFVQSKTGLIYSYTGLKKVSAKKGDYVLSGDVLGKTGKGSEASIKFMVFQNGMPVDPVKAPRG